MQNMVLEPLFEAHIKAVLEESRFAENETAAVFLLALLASNQVAARKRQ